MRGSDDLHLRDDLPTVDANGIRPPRAYAIEPGGPRDGVTVLRLAGELDMAATDELRSALAPPDRARGMVLDLAEVTFVDSAVLKELLRARDELAAGGVRLVLADVTGPVRRLLDLTRTSELFEDAPDAAAALRRLSG